MDTENPPEVASPGGSIRFGVGGLFPRLATSYLLLSSHLQIRWQTRPAATATRNDVKQSNEHTSFLYLSGGGSLLIISHSAQQEQILLYLTTYHFAGISVLAQGAVGADAGL